MTGDLPVSCGVPTGTTGRQKGNRAATPATEVPHRPAQDRNRNQKTPDHLPARLLHWRRRSLPLLSAGTWVLVDTPPIPVVLSPFGLYGGTTIITRGCIPVITIWNERLWATSYGQCRIPLQQH